MRAVRMHATVLLSTASVPRNRVHTAVLVVTRVTDVMLKAIIRTSVGKKSPVNLNVFAVTALGKRTVLAILVNQATFQSFVRA